MESMIPATFCFLYDFHHMYMREHTVLLIHLLVSTSASWSIHSALQIASLLNDFGSKYFLALV